MVRELFPHARQACDLKGLLRVIILYALVKLVGSFIFGFLDGIILIGFVFDILDWALSIYCAIGVMVAVFVFLRFIK